MLLDDVLELVEPPELPSASSTNTNAHRTDIAVFIKISKSTYFCRVKKHKAVWSLPRAYR